MLSGLYVNLADYHVRDVVIRVQISVAPFLLYDEINGACNTTIH